MTRRRRIAWWALVALVALADCADIEPIAEGVCGNGVLDPGEDCDTFASAPGVDVRCGPPSTQVACRYVCVDDGCPVGWGCGVDGICRQPSGELRAVPSLSSWSPSSFQPVDFNGDGHVDVVGAFPDRVELRLGDGTGTFVEAVARQTPPLTGEVSAGELDTDAYGDVLLPTSQGVLVWRGQASGAPLQTAYSAVAVESADAIWSIPLSYPPLGPEGLVMTLFHDTKGLQATISSYVDWKPNPPIPLGSTVPLEQLSDHLAIGDLDHDEQDEVVIGLEGGGALSVYTIAHDLLSGAYQLAASGVIDVSSPRACASCEDSLHAMRVDRGVRMADVDGDGIRDLLASVTSLATGSRVVVVRGNGAGGFGEPYVEAAFSLLSSPATVAWDALAPADPSPWPIAAGDLDGDGIADYVGQNGVFRATCAPTGMVLEQTDARHRLDAWTTATLADIDGDGGLDIAAIAKGEPFVDVLLRDPAEPAALTFATHPYVMDRGVVSMLAPARLRSSGRADLALILSSPNDPARDDELAVMYARPNQPPDPPREHARFHRIDQLEAANARLPGPTEVDDFEDLILATRNADDAVSLGFLFADGAGELTSPFFLPAGIEGRYAVANRALIGAFSMIADPHRDLVVIGQAAGEGPRAWYVEGAEGAAFPNTNQGRDLYLELAPTVELACARFASGDVDGDGRDEIVVAFGGGVCGVAATTEISVGRVTSSATVRFEALGEHAEVVGPTAEIAVSDLDGDGASDVILASTGRAQVWWGSAAGLQTDASSFDLPGGERVLSVVPVAQRTSTRSPTPVAVLTDASLVMLSTHGAVRHESGGATDVRSADVDGDGLGDLLLRRADGMQVLVEVPAAPLGGAR